MTEKDLCTLAWAITQRVHCFRIGDTRVTPIRSPEDFNTICTSLVLFVGILLDFNVLVAEGDGSTRGRVFSYAFTRFCQSLVDLTPLFLLLDAIADITLDECSAVDQFKADRLLKQLAGLSMASDDAPLKGIVMALCRSSVKKDGSHVTLMAMLRQISSFLKKVEITREDLEAQAYADFISAEADMATYHAIAHGNYEYLTDIDEMSRLASPHVQGFKIGPLVTRHGPGAVAEKGARSWCVKHSVAHTDSRIRYLLAKSQLGTVTDYLPYAKEGNGTRTSRFCAVPKNWKKLRGISAEPADLAYFQQGVANSIGRMFRADKFWSSSINLHDQTRSRALALEGSRTGEYSTIDLSNASDSVTLQLVKDVFGNSELCRWLLGTRSLSTNVDGRLVELRKFAPMGSACCFPVETMIFTLAAKVAVLRTCTSLENTRRVQVFGDDIILPTYATQELLSILSHLGFTVNSAKSYWEGDFREACGVEAWRGWDITPCRLKKAPRGILSPRTTYEEFASLSSFCNELFIRGLHITREFLLSHLLVKEVKLGKTKVLCQNALIFDFNTEHSTMLSNAPTNFHLKKRWDRNLQTTAFKRLVWVMKPDADSLALAKECFTLESVETLLYNDWLINHQCDEDEKPEIGVSHETLAVSGALLPGAVISPWARLPIGTSMVPKFSWVVAERFLTS